MIIASPLDYREAAQKRLPPFLFHYIDGGAGTESTLHANRDDLCGIQLRQRVLQGSDNISLQRELFGQSLKLPIVLAPVGLTGMYARRGEVQAARAAKHAGIPFTLSTVSVCSIDEVVRESQVPPWFQLYVLKDRAFMRHALDAARAANINTLVFTVDMPVPGSRYRDAHSGMSGRFSRVKRWLQACTHPRWTWDVGVRGRPHDLGNISNYLGKPVGLLNYIGWLAANFDPGVSWQDLQWIRNEWSGRLIIKGILDAEDARTALNFGADGIVVSNHGGRQMDGALSSVKALPMIAEAIGDQLTVLVDGGVRTGLDVVRMLALGADAVMLGRAYIYALAAAGEHGVTNLLMLMEKEMRTTMTLCGARSLADLNSTILA
ncbi:MAG: FMN-dependent L-lactate dehydrogenase LldD [Steroidobacter sp.]